jgi:hypothetical protein
MKPIKLDDRERDLARRCFGYLVNQLSSSPPDTYGALTKVARDWMHDEIVALKQKFEP